MPHDVFISYSSKDKPTANAVCGILESNRIRCWIAPRDLLPGVPYAEALIDAISESKVFVLVFSENANKSQQVMREVERAVSLGISIIPLRIEDVPMSKQLEYYVSSVHWLDALTPPLEKHLNNLSEIVQSLLNLAGKEVPRKCSECGTALKAEELKCSTCGQEFVKEAVPKKRITTEAFLEEKEKKADILKRTREAKKKKIWGTILVVFGVTTGIIFFLSMITGLAEEEDKISLIIGMLMFMAFFTFLPLALGIWLRKKAKSLVKEEK